MWESRPLRFLLGGLSAEQSSASLKFDPMFQMEHFVHTFIASRYCQRYASDYGGNRRRKVVIAWDRLRLSWPYFSGSYCRNEPLLGRGGVPPNFAQGAPGAPIQPTLFEADQFFDQLGVIFLFQPVDLLIVLIHLRGIIHRAEFGTAHGAEGRLFVVIVRQGFIVHRARRLG